MARNLYTTGTIGLEAGMGKGRMLPEVDHLERKLSNFLRLSDAEKRCLSEIQQSPIYVKSGQELTRQGEGGHVAYILQQGWGCSFKILHDGSAWRLRWPAQHSTVYIRSLVLGCHGRPGQPDRSLSHA